MKSYEEIIWQAFYRRQVVSEIRVPNGNTNYFKRVYTLDNGSVVEVGFDGLGAEWFRSSNQFIKKAGVYEIARHYAARSAIDIDKARRQCRDALNKTSNKDAIIKIASLLNIRI